jgi:hypothetical protein
LSWGGANRKTVTELKAGGTYRLDRHAGRQDERPSEPTTPSQRRQVTTGLQAAGRRFALTTLAAYGDWNPADLQLLRQAAAVVDRIEALQQSADLHVAAELRRERRILLATLKALNLE